MRHALAWSLLAFVILLVAFIVRLPGAVPPPPVHVFIYVATAGSDKNPGTYNEPVATLAQAQKLARKALSTKAHELSVSVIVRGGTYYLVAPLEITPDDVKPRVPVGYAAHHDGVVVLSGGQEIRGWKAVGDVWQAEVPDVKSGKWNFVDLYVGEERRPRARTPNQDYFRIEKAGDDKRTGFFFRPGDVKAWAIPGEAEVVFLHDWSTSRIRVKQIDEAGRKLTFSDPIGPNAPHYAIDAFEPHPRYFLEGAREFLDQPGEWHLETATGVLTYKPQPGEKIEAFVAIAPRLTNLIRVQGTPENPVRGLEIGGFTLAHCAWLSPEHGYAGNQAGFFEQRSGEPGSLKKIQMEAAVKVDYAQHVGIYRCRIVHHGGAGVWLERSCGNCRVTDCTVEDIGGNGLMVGETASRDDAEVTQKVSLLKNHVHRCGQRYFGAVGIWLGLVADCTVEECEVGDLPYTGISVGWSWNVNPTSCRGNVIRLNAIYRCMNTLSDGGGIYTLGRQPGTLLSRNQIHDIPANSGRAESNGMFLDEGSSEFVIEHNNIYGIAKSPIRFHQATRLTLKNNRLVTLPGVPTFRYNSADPTTMKFEQNEEVTAEKAPSKK